MTDFKVAFANGVVQTYTGRYLIDDNAVLTIYTDKDTRLIFSPSGWLSIEENTPTSAYEGHEVSFI